jgi:hypothetical protein
MPVSRHVERHFTSGNTFRDIGMSDAGPVCAGRRPVRHRHIHVEKHFQGTARGPTLSAE